MIDFQKIKQELTPKRMIIELFVNLPALALIIYGLKCLVTLQSKTLLSVQGAVYSSLHIHPVTGMDAAMVGLLYVFFGLFIYFSDGSIPPEGRRWPWRFGRALLRWGSLVLALLCFFSTRSHKLADFGSGFDLLKLIGFILGFITLLMFLFAMLAREKVKKDLWLKSYKPIHILWRPAAYWMSRFGFVNWPASGFRVVYSDPSYYVHKGYCVVSRLNSNDSQWGNPCVIWLADSVTGQLPLPKVYVDSEIIHPKLPCKTG